MEKTLAYSRDQVAQDTFYNCAPAAAQTVIRAATNQLIPEATLGRKMGTTTNGTNHIGLVTDALNQYVPGAEYETVLMPNDPPSSEQRERLWRDVCHSIDRGYGVVANIVAPPSNYPRRSYTSTENLRYHGGTVYHYVAVMGYATDENGGRHVWLADSGFPPFGCWVTLEQMATLIPPKGYTYA